MPKLTAFVASSFLPPDQPKVQSILDHLQTLKPLGFVWTSAEPAESESVSHKVQELIKAQNIFIGILTSRHAIYPANMTLKQRFDLARGMFKPQRFSAPPWVLQECGFALASGKHLVLYVEPGVEIGGLQGDLEYIDFPYPNVGDALLKTNEMINRLIAKHSGIVVDTVVIDQPPASPLEQGKETNGGDDLAAGISGTPTTQEPTPLGKLWMKMIDANYSQDATVGDNYFQEGLALIRQEGSSSEVSEVIWKTFYYAKRLSDGKSDAFDSLRELSAENPSEPLTHRYLGAALQKYGEFEQALVQFEAGMNASSPEDKYHYAIYYATCLKKLNRLADAERLLLKTLEQENLQGSATLEILAQLYDVLKKQNRSIEAFAIAEHSLQMNPAQKDFRFSTALDYYRSDFDPLFLHHFSIIVDQDPEDADSLHNLALAYDQCGLPLLSVEAYKKAIRGGVWLSAQNLGQLYLTAGMADETADLVHQISARDGSTSAEIMSLLADIEKKKKKEASLRGEAQDRATERKQFLARFGAAYLNKTPINVDGDWKFPFGIASLKRDGIVLKGKRTEKRQLSGLHKVLLGLGAPGDGPTERTESTVVTGSIVNHAAQITITTSSEPESILYGKSSNERKLFIAFSLEGNSGYAAEINDGKIETMHSISKISPDAV
jgi:Tfp pilus assembly protein PilF